MSESGYERHLERRLDQLEKDNELLERALNSLEKSVERNQLLVEQQRDIPTRVHDLEVQMVSQRMVAGLAKWVAATIVTAGIAFIFTILLNGPSP